MNRVQDASTEGTNLWFELLFVRYEPELTQGGSGLGPGPLLEESSAGSSLESPCISSVREFPCKLGIGPSLVVPGPGIQDKVSSC